MYGGAHRETKRKLELALKCESERNAARPIQARDQALE